MIVLAADAAGPADGAAAAPGDGRTGFASGGRGRSAVFVEESEQEGDGSHEVQVDDGPPRFRLGVEGARRVLELEITQDR